MLGLVNEMVHSLIKRFNAWESVSYKAFITRSLLKAYLECYTDVAFAVLTRDLFVFSYTKKFLLLLSDMSV